MLIMEHQNYELRAYDNKIISKIKLKYVTYVNENVCHFPLLFYYL